MNISSPHPTGHIKYKLLGNKSTMANKLLLTNLKLFLRRIKSSAYALIAQNLSRINYPKLSKMAIFKPP